VKFFCRFKEIKNKPLSFLRKEGHQPSLSYNQSDAVESYDPMYFYSFG